MRAKVNRHTGKQAQDVNQVKTRQDKGGRGASASVCVFGCHLDLGTMEDVRCENWGINWSGGAKIGDGLALLAGGQRDWHV